jgi:hypothetical protein
MDSLHDTEVSNRIQKGWNKFFAFKSELCGKHVSVKDKFKLFNAVVTPTVLYGSAAWTRNADRTRLLRTAKRRMLRWIRLAAYGKASCLELAMETKLVRAASTKRMRRSLHKSRKTTY